MASRYTTVELPRDCEATVIPGGEPMHLRRGELVTVTQTLGGSYTLQTEMGYLVRIGVEDSSALGLDVNSTSLAPDHAGEEFDPQQVIEALKSVYDPEIPINVVDLGLIYVCEAEPLDDDTYRVEIQMSMTAPGCGMGDILKEDARNAVSAAPGVSDVVVELVWDPPWGPDRMSEAAKLQLGFY